MFSLKRKTKTLILAAVAAISSLQSVRASVTDAIKNGAQRRHLKLNPAVPTTVSGSSETQVPSKPAETAPSKRKTSKDPFYGTNTVFVDKRKTGGLKEVEVDNGAKKRRMKIVAESEIAEAADTKDDIDEDAAPRRRLTTMENAEEDAEVAEEAENSAPRRHLQNGRNNNNRNQRKLSLLKKCPKNYRANRDLL